MKNVLPLFAASLCLVALSQPALAQDSEPASPAPQVIKRGQDYSVYARITPYLDEEGNTQYATNHTFTLLENALS